MQEIYTNSLKKILSNKKELEKELDVKITNRGKLIFLASENPLKEYIACQAIEALNLGFNLKCVLLLKKPEFQLEKIPIKNISRRKKLAEVRGRIIGTKGTTIELLQTLSNCPIALNGNIVGVIGDYEDIENARRAVERIIRGSKQGNVYSYLERQRKRNKAGSKSF